MHWELEIPVFDDYSHHKRRGPDGPGPNDRNGEGCRREDTRAAELRNDRTKGKGGGNYYECDRGLQFFLACRIPIRHTDGEVRRVSQLSKEDLPVALKGDDRSRGIVHTFAGSCCYSSKAEPPRH